MSNRELGYYWCKYDGDWYVGEYCKENVWYLCGFPEVFYEKELQEIDELMIPTHAV